MSETKSTIKELAKTHHDTANIDLIQLTTCLWNEAHTGYVLGCSIVITIEAHNVLATYDTLSPGSKRDFVAVRSSMMLYSLFAESGDDINAVLVLNPSRMQLTYHKTPNNLHLHLRQAIGNRKSNEHGRTGIRLLGTF